jgi:galactonate dehydratase
MGSPVNLAAFVQLEVAIPKNALQESNTAADMLNGIVDEPLQRAGGYVMVPDRPGIGMELREEMLSRFPYRPNAVTASAHEDGSVAH